MNSHRHLSIKLVWILTTPGVVVPVDDGTLGGIAAGIAAGWFLLDPLASFVTARGWFQQPLALRGAVLVADGLVGLVVFGLVRRMIEKFVKFLVPGTLNVILGGVVGGGIAFVLWRAGEMAVELFR